MNAPDLVSAALDIALHGLLSCEVARADSDHHGARLRHPPFDPLAPIPIAAREQCRLEFRRGLQVLVEGLPDRIDIAPEPRLEHLVELGPHLLRVLDCTLEELPLGIFGEAVEEGELLLVGLELTDRLARVGERASQNRRDALVATVGWQTLRYSFARLTAEPDACRRDIRATYEARCRLFGMR